MLMTLKIQKGFFYIIIIMLDCYYKPLIARNPVAVTEVKGFLHNLNTSDVIFYFRGPFLCH